MVKVNPHDDISPLVVRFTTNIFDPRTPRQDSEFYNPYVKRVDVDDKGRRFLADTKLSDVFLAKKRLLHEAYPGVRQETINNYWDQVEQRVYAAEWDNMTQALQYIHECEKENIRYLETLSTIYAIRETIGELEKLAKSSGMRNDDLMELTSPFYGLLDAYSSYFPYYTEGTYSKIKIEPQMVKDEATGKMVSKPEVFPHYGPLPDYGPSSGADIENPERLLQALKASVRTNPTAQSIFAQIREKYLPEDRILMNSTVNTAYLPPEEIRSLPINVLHQPVFHIGRALRPHPIYTPDQYGREQLTIPSMFEMPEHYLEEDSESDTNPAIYYLKNPLPSKVISRLLPKNQGKTMKGNITSIINAPTRAGKKMFPRKNALIPWWEK